jgi:hypothetical protein
MPMSIDGIQYITKPAMEYTIISEKLGGGGLYPPADLLPYLVTIGKTTKFIKSGTSIKNQPNKLKNVAIKLKMIKKVMP